MKSAWIHFYELYPHSHLNSRYSKSPKPGVLLKVDFGDEKIGYADYQLGSKFEGVRLFEVLKFIRNSLSLEDFQWTLSQAQIDAEFRSKNQGGFDSYPHINIPSHYLIVDIKNFSSLKLLDMEAKGYRYFKVKMGRNLRSETIALKKLCESCGGMFRLDFNESLEMKDFRLWLKRNSDLLKKIDFIEDPIPFNSSQWQFLSKEYPIRLALDMAAKPLEVDPSAFQVLILKPAIQNIKRIMERYKDSHHSIVLTHYMDHPVGQSTAAWWAYWMKEKFGNRVIECGLQDPGLFEKTPFFIESISPNFSPPRGLGWGFDQQLQEVKWVAL